jgi:hypothetical protein
MSNPELNHMKQFLSLVDGDHDRVWRLQGIEDAACHFVFAHGFSAGENWMY